MEKMKITAILIGVTLISAMAVLGITAVCAQDNVKTVWVSSADASLKSDKKASSDTVITVVFGTELKVLQYDNKWYQVETDSKKKGWVYRGKVSTEQPESSETGTEGLLGELAAVSIRADAADSSRSMRGLSPEARAYAKNQGTPQEMQQEVDSLMLRKLNVEDITQFLKTGKIGEYAE